VSLPFCLGTDGTFDPPASALVAEITGMHHSAQLLCLNSIPCFALVVQGALLA
jgi:hypothetical protein